MLCEQFIERRRSHLPGAGRGRDARALPVVRIVAPEGNYDYQNKYFTDDTKYLCPSGLPEGEEHEIQRIALRPTACSAAAAGAAST